MLATLLAFDWFRTQSTRHGKKKEIRILAVRIFTDMFLSLC